MTSAAKHTPGPWRIDPRAACRVVAGENDTVASAGCQSNLADQYEANARLIAAAPDMLEAIQKALCCAEIDGLASAMAVLNTHGRAAIAKATQD